MAVDNEIPDKSFWDRPTENYICPTCIHGRLKPVADSFSSLEPTYSATFSSSPHGEPEATILRFSFQCECINADCGEIAFATGTGEVMKIYDDDEEYGTRWAEYFQIQAFFPAPYLFNIPSNTPEDVKKTLEACFSLYWINVNASANALRVSLEILLDHLEIPRCKLNGKGKPTYLNLFDRINIWEKQDKENAELCEAVREVGNLGSHGENVLLKDLTGVLQIYEHVLGQFVENNGEKMKNIAQNIVAKIRARKDSERNDSG